MQSNRVVMDRMLADRAARNRRIAQWQGLADQLRRRQAEAARAANDDAAPPARAV